MIGHSQVVLGVDVVGLQGLQQRLLGLLIVFELQVKKAKIVVAVDIAQLGRAPVGLLSLRITLCMQMDVTQQVQRLRMIVAHSLVEVFDGSIVIAILVGHAAQVEVATDTVVLGGFLEVLAGGVVVTLLEGHAAKVVVAARIVVLGSPLEVSAGNVVITVLVGHDAQVVVAAGIITVGGPLEVSMSIGAIITCQAHRANAIHPARVVGTRLGKVLEALLRSVQILCSERRPALVIERSRLLGTERFFIREPHGVSCLARVCHVKGV